MNRSKVWLRWPPWADIALALGVCLLGLIELAVSGQETVSVVSVAVMTLPVAFRRRAPLGAAIVITLWLPVDYALGGEYVAPLTPLLAPMLVAYTVAAHTPPRRAVASTVLLLISVELSLLLAGAGHYGITAFCVALPVLSGASVRRYRARARQLTVLTARLERERGASERLAVAEERRRIAGELHDAIAQAVSRMVVQAAGAEQVLGSAPERARAALIAVQETGRDAITELRHTLRILRSDDEPARRPPGSEQHASAAAAPAPPTISWPWWADVLLAVILIGAVEGPALWNGSTLIVVAAVGAAVAIVLRRRHALGALSLAVIEAVILVVAGYGDRVVSPFMAVLVVLYTLAVYGPPRRSVFAAAVAIVTLEIAVVAAGEPEGVVAVGVWTAAAWAAGRVEGASRRQAERLQDAAARLARERDALARLAALDERSRIARELHDSVAHTVSVMVLQAGAAEQVLASAPDEARAAARAVAGDGPRRTRRATRAARCSCTTTRTPPRARRSPA